MFLSCLFLAPILDVLFCANSAAFPILTTVYPNAGFEPPSHRNIVNTNE